jgi:hypothetical protein
MVGDTDYASYDDIEKYKVGIKIPNPAGDTDFFVIARVRDDKSLEFPASYPAIYYAADEAGREIARLSEEYPGTTFVAFEAFAAVTYRHHQKEVSAIINML